MEHPLQMSCIRLGALEIKKRGGNNNMRRTIKYIYDSPIRQNDTLIHACYKNDFFRGDRFIDISFVNLRRKPKLMRKTCMHVTA